MILSKPPVRHVHSGSVKPATSFLSRIAGFFSSLVDELVEDASVEGEVASGRPRRTARRRNEFTARFPLVGQDDETGCGVACIAMLVGQDYEKVKAALFDSQRKRVFYTTYKDLRRGLERYGLSLEDGRARRFKSFAEIDGTAIVAVDQTPPVKSRWHWVVFVHDGRRRYVLDPSWDGVVRTNLRALRGRTFLQVIPAPPPADAKSAPTRRTRRAASASRSSR